MTIFRFEAVCLLLLLASCTDNRPSADTELGRIARIAEFEAAEAELKRFTEQRLPNRPALRREFAAAGFRRSNFRDEKSIECERFDWTSTDFFPVIMFVTICGDRVCAGVGPRAP